MNAEVPSVLPPEKDESPAATSSSSTRMSSLATAEQSAADLSVTSEKKVSSSSLVRQIPLAAWVVFLVEFGERLSYYGTKNVYLTYTTQMLGMSSSMYAILQNFNNAMNFGPFLLLAGYLADAHIGAFRTIAMFAPVYLVGLVLLLSSVIPGVAFADYPYSPTWAMGGFWGAIIVMGIGCGFIKPVISVFAVDQLKDKKTLSEPNPRLVETLYLWWYMIINVGSFVGQFIAPVLVGNIEKLKDTCSVGAMNDVGCSSLCGEVGDLCVGVTRPDASLSDLCCAGGAAGTGYWIAWSQTLGLFVLAFGIFYACMWKPGYVICPPSGSLLPAFCRSCVSACKHRKEKRDEGPVAWLSTSKFRCDVDSRTIDQFRMALHACKPFLFMLPFWWSNLATMDYLQTMCLGMFEEYGIMDCNQISNFNGIGILTIIPILDVLIFPLLRNKVGMKLQPMSRFVFGLVLVSIPWMFLVGFYFWSITHGQYQGVDLDTWVGNPGVSKPSIWLQAPAFAIGGIAEVFVNISSMEWAYSASPAGFKSLILAVNLCTSFAGYTIVGFIVNPFFTAKSQPFIYCVSLGVQLLVVPLFLWFNRGYKSGRELRPDLYEENPKVAESFVNAPGLTSEFSVRPELEDAIPERSFREFGEPTKQDHH